MGLIRADLASLGVPTSCSSRSASWSRAARSTSALAALSERGLIYDGRAGAAQGQAAR